MANNLALLLLVCVSVSRADIFRQRIGQRYDTIPLCAREYGENAAKCAQRKSLVTTADRNNPARVCCYEWILEDCWDDLVRTKCGYNDYMSWQVFKRATIDGLEQGLCRRDPYTQGIESCSGSFHREPQQQDKRSAAVSNAPAIMLIVASGVACQLLSR